MVEEMGEVGDWGGGVMVEEMVPGQNMSLPVDLSSLQGFQGAEREAALGTLEKQLLCPICLDIFTKPVVILPCQHNLCRRCANELYQPSLFLARTTMTVNSGRFRCPTCRQEVVLDRHGVYGLQRNLLVENIIDVYKQELSSPAVASPAPTAKPVGEVNCVDHQGEKLNIYCLSCQKPTCSLCKVFGSHRLCQVAPLADIHQQQKAELEQELSSLMAKNDQVQAFINKLELTWRNVEENCKSQKQSVCNQFDTILSILEERRKAMTQQISSDEEDKTGCAQSLMRCYGDSVEANSKLLEAASRTMEEPDMATFVKVCVLRAATISSPPKTFEPDGKNITHYRFNFSNQERALRSLDFIGGQEHFPKELQQGQEHFPKELQPEQAHYPEEPQPENAHYPAEQKVEESKPNLGSSAEIWEPKTQRESITTTVQTSTQESAVHNVECVFDQALEPILAFIPPLAPTESILATADPVSLVLGAVVASLEPAPLVPEDNLSVNDQTVLKERGKGRAEESREEEKQEEREQVEDFKTPDSIKDIQCEDQDGMNTQQCEVREHQIDGEKGGGREEEIEKGEKETWDVKQRGEDPLEEDVEGRDGCEEGAMLYPEWYAAGGWCNVSPGLTESKDAFHGHNGPPQPCQSQALSQLMHPELGDGIEPKPRETFRSETAGRSRTVEVQEEEEEEEEDSDGLVSSGPLHSDLQKGLLLGSAEQVCLALGRDGPDPGVWQEAGEVNFGDSCKEQIESGVVFASKVENMNEKPEELVVEPGECGEQLKEYPEPADAVSTLKENNCTPTDSLELGGFTLVSGETGDVAPQPENDPVPEESPFGLEVSALEATENERELLGTGSTGRKMDNGIAAIGQNMVFTQAVILLFYLLGFLLILQRLWAYLGCFMFT
ncbi:Tripartite motif-containing protein 55 [Merluccius polli]|uniref:Tripartite motif-containing protein 55 n=1 Tax=Merluccius polli TaxID=89951 RepID=A0AA47N6B4_MERPO|nr:Tripartite motif-containing protein 55 [Merluccius polli]